MTHNIVEQFYRDYFRAPESRQLDVAQTKLNPDVKFCAAHPINDLYGPDKSHQGFLSPLKHALPDVERRLKLSSKASMMVDVGITRPATLSVCLRTNYLVFHQQEKPFIYAIPRWFV